MFSFFFKYIWYHRWRGLFGYLSAYWPSHWRQVGADWPYGTCSCKPAFSFPVTIIIATYYYLLLLLFLLLWSQYFLYTTTYVFLVYIYIHTHTQNQIVYNYWSLQFDVTVSLLLLSDCSRYDIFYVIMIILYIYYNIISIYYSNIF